MIKKIFKILGLSILGLVVVLVLTTVLFVWLSPEFGGTHTDADKERYARSGHYIDDKFENLIATNMDMSFTKGIGIMIRMLRGIPGAKPDFELPVEKLEPSDLDNPMPAPRLIWFGHSAFLLQIEGKNILIDPMFGEVPAPHPTLGNRRFFDDLPIAIEELPAIDIMLISHDHYDHLDYGSIMKLEEKTKAFFLPLGVGAHFRAWGVDEESIVEFNWWDEVEHQGLRLAFTPSRHFSGRGFNDRFSTLWGSWVINGQQDNIFFSGDGGYGPHFKEIGKRFGPFDFAMLECGQYNEMWKDIHMMPEETAQAAIDVKAKVMMPIHWGAFNLALHSWTDPIERVLVKADELQVPIVIPFIGERLDLQQVDTYKTTAWWEGP